MTEDEMVGWHHQLDGHEFNRAPGAGEGQGSLVCCSPWGCKEPDTTERPKATLLTVPEVSHQVPTAPGCPPTHWRLLCRVLHKKLVLKPLRAGVAPSSDLGSLPSLYYLVISFSTAEIPPVASNSQTTHVRT